MRASGRRAGGGDARHATLGGEPVAAGAAAAFDRAARPPPCVQFAGPRSAGRATAVAALAVAPHAPTLKLRARLIIEWHGGQRWWLRTSRRRRCTPPARPAAMPSCRPAVSAGEARAAAAAGGAGADRAPPAPDLSTRTACSPATDPALIPSLPTHRTVPNTPALPTARLPPRCQKCVHCGFCTATCPTYQPLGDELDNARASTRSRTCSKAKHRRANCRPTSTAA